MTQQQIEQLPAGRELDALIAEKVMGWREQIAAKGPYVMHQGQPIWLGGHKDMPMSCAHFSTELAAAKQVQAKLFADGYDVQIWQNHDPAANSKMFLVQASKNAYYSLAAPEPIWADGETEALALAHVALLTTLT